MKAIVIGATGATGKYLVQDLLANNAFKEVIVLVRRQSFSPHQKLKEIVVDFNDLDQYKNEIDADVAFSVMGTTLKDAGSKDAQWKVDYDYQYDFAQLCASQNVKNFVLLSATGASSTSSLFYNRMKGKLDEEVQKLNFEKLIIFRPASLNRPNSNRFSEKLMTAVMSGFNSVGLLNNYKVIHVKDLANALMNSVFNTTNGITILNVKGILDLKNKA